MVADLHFRATTFPRKGGSRGGGGGPCPRPPSLACAIFFARHGCWRSDIPRGLHPSALSTELLKVSELPHLSLTLTLAQPRCNCKCNLTLTLDSRYNGRHAQCRIKLSGGPVPNADWGPPPFPSPLPIEVGPLPSLRSRPPKFS